MNSWKVIPTIVFATVLIFGAGVFTGGILVDIVKQARPHPPAKSHPSSPIAAAGTNNPTANATRPPPQLLSKDFLQRLDSQLNLTKEEHNSIQKIISDGQNEMRKVIQDTRLEIREVLTAEQRDQFDVLMKRPFHKPIFPTNSLPIAVSTNAP